MIGQDKRATDSTQSVGNGAAFEALLQNSFTTRKFIKAMIGQEWLQCIKLQSGLRAHALQGALTAMRRSVLDYGKAVRRAFE